MACPERKAIDNSWETVINDEWMVKRTCVNPREVAKVVKG